MEISWIDGNNNFINIMTTAKFCHTFQELINTSTVKIKTLDQMRWSIG